jgi:hypothetical protein
MNVELEFQIRKSLGDYLETGQTGAPQPPGEVQQQDLPPPTLAPTLPPASTLAPSAAPATPTLPSAVPFAVPGPTPLTR